MSMEMNFFFVSSNQALILFPLNLFHWFFSIVQLLHLQISKLLDYRCYKNVSKNETGNSNANIKTMKKKLYQLTDFYMDGK